MFDGLHAEGAQNAKETETPWEWSTDCKNSERNEANNVKKSERNEANEAKEPEMFTPQKILVPTDFSLLSQEAISTASDLAQTYGARLTLLHVFEPPALVFPEGALFLMQEATDRL